MAEGMNRKTMEITKMLYTITLFSVLFHAAAYIIDCKLLLCSSRGNHYIGPEMNASCCSHSMYQCVMTKEWEMFGKGYSQMISVAATSNFGQSEDLKVTSRRFKSEIISLGKLNQNAFCVKRDSLNDAETRNELKVNKQNRRVSMHSHVSSRQSTYVQSVKENRQSYNEHDVSSVDAFSGRLLRTTNSRKLTEARNIAKETRNIRQTNNKKDTIRDVRNRDRSENLLLNTKQADYMKDYLRRSLVKERIQKCAARYRNFQSKSLATKNHERRSDISVNSHEQEIAQLEISRKTSSSPAAYLILKENRKTRNDDAFSRAQHLQQRVRSSKYANAIQRRATERLNNKRHLEKSFTKEATSTIVNYENHNIAQNMRHIGRSHGHALRKIARCTNGAENVKLPSLRISNERLSHVRACHLYNSDFFNTDQCSIKATSNLKNFEQVPTRKIHKIRHFSRMDTSFYSILPSEVFDKRIEISQRIECKIDYNMQFERFLRRDRYLFGSSGQHHECMHYSNNQDRRQKNLMERRNRLFHPQNDHLALIDNSIPSQSFSSANMDKSVQNTRKDQHAELYRSSIHMENKHLTFSYSVPRREVDNQLYGEEFQRRMQHRSTFHELSIQHRNNFSGGTFYFSRMNRILLSRADNGEYPERITANTIGRQRSVRSTLKAGSSLNRWKQSLVYRGRNLFQDQMPHRRQSVGKGRYENDSQISLDRHRVQKEQALLRSFYRNLDKHYSTITRSYIERKGRKLRMEHRDYQLTKVDAAINTRRLINQVATLFDELQNQLDLFRIKKQNRILENVARNLNKDVAIRKAVPEFRLSYRMHQDSFFQEYENFSDYLKTVSMGVVDKIFKAGNNQFGWKLYIDNDSYKAKMMHEADGLQHTTVTLPKSKSIGIQDLVITGIGVFAAVRLYSRKEIE